MITTNLTTIHTASTNQSAQGLIVQSYCVSILEQAPVNFDGLTNVKNVDKIKDIGKQINAALESAKEHARNYLSNLQPMILQNLSNIGNWCALNQAVPTSLPAGSTKQLWLDTLTVLSGKAGEYQANAETTARSIRTLSQNLANDSAKFAEIVNAFKVLVDGDNGALKDLTEQLDTIQSKIDGAIAGIVLSAFAIIGGVFMIAVGAIAEFVTAGTSTGLVMAGCAVVAAGIGGEVASGVMLSQFLDAKRNMIMDQKLLKQELNLANSMQSAFTGYNEQVKKAVQASDQMANAWTLLGSDLKNLRNDLDQGVQSADAIRRIFLVAADTEIKKVNADVEVIRAQMTGVQEVKVPRNVKMGDFVRNHYRRAA